MAFVTKAFTTTCPAELLDALNADANIAPACLQIINTGDGNSTFEFASALSAGEDAYLDSFLAAWVCPTDTGGGGDDTPIDDTGPPSDDTSWSSEKIENEIQEAQASIVGNMHQMQFHESSTLGNEWLEYGTAGIYSNGSHGVMPFKSKLVAVTFSNLYSGVDCKLQFYSTPEGGGSSPKTLDLEWVLTNKRTARKTNFGSDIIFEAGDKVGVYYKDNGTNGNDVVVMMYFQVLEENSEESGENWSGNYATGSGGGSD